MQKVQVSHDFHNNLVGLFKRGQCRRGQVLPYFHAKPPRHAMHPPLVPRNPPPPPPTPIYTISLLSDSTIITAHTTILSHFYQLSLENTKPWLINLELQVPTMVPPMEPPMVDYPMEAPMSPTPASTTTLLHVKQWSS